MPEKLQNIVIWKARAIPGHRIIPAHLKLAILSRGRINLPVANIMWLIELAKAKGSTWPDRLRKPLSQIFSELPVTIELFQKQQRSMTVMDIDQSLKAYLTLRKNRDLPMCFFLLFSWFFHVNRSKLERLLDVDLTRLYNRPRVSVLARDRDRYLLVAYVCIPQRIAHFILPAVPPPPPPPAQKMPPLEGLTARNVERNLRTQPKLSAPILGDQDGDVKPVRVLNKAKGDGHEWLQIELTTPLRVKKDGKRINLAAGTKCWLERGGLDIVIAPWPFFRHQLITFEKDNGSFSVNGRITKLRQMSHNKSMPFDNIIGTNKGTLYLDDRPFIANKWQLVKDYEAVRAPDGRSIDIHHILVGLDVLSRTQRWAYFLKILVGSNWAAATWSGDLGAGAADMSLKLDKNWERRHPKAEFRERADHYFQSRGAEWDLLSDIDIWELNAARRSGLGSIDTILASYYEKTQTGGQRTLTTNRRDALQRFLAHYGFAYEYNKDISRYPALIRQHQAVRRTAWEIAQFAQIWMYYRKPTLLINRDKKKRRPVPGTVAAMNTLLVHWLEYTAIENGAEVPHPPSP